MKKNQNGITLVALVITIIVLLILAGVTLAALSGQNGILSRGAESKVATNIANAKDLISVAINEGITEYYNEKYVETSETTVDDDIGTYICGKLATKSDTSTSNKITQAASVIASISGNEITTNVKDANDQTMTATLGTDGKITWENDATEKSDTNTTGGNQT